MTYMEIQTPANVANNGYKVDVSRGERIGRVSSEWFNRPADERYLSLTDLHNSVKRRSERSRTRIIESEAIRIEASRDNAERLVLAIPGSEQTDRSDPLVVSVSSPVLSAHLPPTYASCRPRSPASIYNMAFPRTAEQVKTLEIENGRKELRAVTGPDYGRYLNGQAVSPTFH